jgi:hypothetical protein
MKFWMSGEIQADVSDAFRPLCNRIEASLNDGLAGRDYGGGLLKWNYVAIILSDDGPKGYIEVNRYNKRDKSCEFRLKVDHDQFKDGDTKTRATMLCESLLRSLSLLESMNVPSVDVKALQEDFTNIARRQEWL